MISALLPHRRVVVRADTASLCRRSQFLQQRMYFLQRRDRDFWLLCQQQAAAEHARRHPSRYQTPRAVLELDVPELPTPPGSTPPHRQRFFEKGVPLVVDGYGLRKLRSV